MAAFSAEDLRRVSTETSKPLRDSQIRGPADEIATPAAANDSEFSSIDMRSAMLASAMSNERNQRPYSPIVLAGLVRVAETILLFAAAYISYLIYLSTDQSFSIGYIYAAAGLSAATAVIFQSLRLYTIGSFRRPIQAGLLISMIWSALMVAAMGTVFILKLQETYSRGWFIIWYVLGLVMLLTERLVLREIVSRMTRSGRLERRTVIVGGGPEAEGLLELISAQTNSDIRIFGIFDDRDDIRSPPVVMGYSKLGTIDDLVEFARTTHIDVAIVTLPITAETRLLQMLRKLWILPIDIRLSSHSNKLKLHPRAYSYLGGVPVLDVFDKPIADWDIITKSLFDRVIGLICLILLAPVLLCVAIAVKLDSKGPVLFRQKRHGFNNETIDVLKFRSMYVNQADMTAQKQVTRDDPRVTRVGRFIRRTSLDELPQLFNVVLQGNLSLVGPRPHAVGGKAANREYDEVVEGYFARHRVKPGITGWAQVNGWRGETDTPEKMQARIEHDLYYIEHWSIFLDLYILLITPFAVLKGKNAF